MTGLVTTLSTGVGDGGIGVSMTALEGGCHQVTNV